MQQVMKQVVKASPQGEKTIQNLVETGVLRMRGQRGQQMACESHQNEGTMYTFGFADGALNAKRSGPERP